MRADRTRLPQPGPDPSFRFPSIARHTLPNGLKVRTLEHGGVPVVTFVLMIEGGLGADPPGKEGLASIAADMVDEGTGSLSAIDVSDALARIGAEYDVEVAPDATLFTVTTLARFAPRGAQLLSDLVVRPSMRETDFARVRQLRLDRLRQLKDLPPALAERAFMKLLYPSHPYGHLAIGTDAALRGLQLSDVVAFHGATYRAADATLVIGGSLQHSELIKIAADAFGAWPSPGVRPTAVTAADQVPAPTDGTRLA